MSNLDQSGLCRLTLFLQLFLRAKIRVDSYQGVIFEKKTILIRLKGDVIYVARG